MERLIRYIMSTFFGSAFRGAVFATLTLLLKHGL